MALEDAKTQVDQAFTRANARGLSFENAFGGATSFLRRRYSKDLSGVQIAVTGIPFDQAVTNRPGTRFGPRALREASTLQAFDAPYGWGYDPFSELAITDYGDMAFDYANVAEVPGRIEAHLAGIVSAGVVPITLGGDHFITLPILRAIAAHHGEIALIQFDAHSDTWADDDMDRIDHGTFLYKAIKTGVVAAQNTVSVGIRTDNPDTLGVTILDAPMVHQEGIEATLSRIRAVVGDKPCYVTFDIDCLDPAFAPGTGTPVWGGLASWQAAALLRGLKGINLIGGDVVEVSPPYDTTGATAIAGAHVATELIALAGWNMRGGQG
ncbi:agmatinase [Thioclava sp. L04-15]|uniref:agmatinase n=1 Tax=Thioclava sp. L04-15 TaxID=1915318 RepID=UPI0009975554|nr:agmatinase [Thioclava sp. L04-15]OOY26575.1 agmatinase [Thioclava sp. L04-15]TNE89676.1 MAG: agmatinase [Paracoccaceae bacterium]